MGQKTDKEKKVELVEDSEKQQKRSGSAFSREFQPIRHQNINHVWRPKAEVLLFYLILNNLLRMKLISRHNKFMGLYL